MIPTLKFRQKLRLYLIEIDLSGNFLSDFHTYTILNFSQE
jgi:hypothetical protein